MRYSPGAIYLPFPRRGRPCSRSPPKAVHRSDLTPEAERRLLLVCEPALLVFGALAYLTPFTGGAAGGFQAAIGAVGIALRALVIPLAIRR